MKKIPALLLLGIALLMSHTCSQATIPEEKAGTPSENWIDYAADGFAGGTGTEDDPYRIATAEQLAYLAKTVNSGDTYENRHFILTTDIDLGGKEWTPIGCSDSYKDSDANFFNGNFDGNEKNIYDLTIKEMHIEAGLFGKAAGVKFKNFRLRNASIAGGMYAGGIVAHGWMIDLSDCTFEGSINAGKAYIAGGLIGYGWSVTINNCDVSVDISEMRPQNYRLLSARLQLPIIEHKDYGTGGIIGCALLDSLITNCRLKVRFIDSFPEAGGIAGRLTGFREGIVAKCNVEGEIIGTLAGGLAGKAGKYQFQHCIFNGTVRGENIGELVGESQKALVINCRISGVFEKTKRSDKGF